uniref:Uncharacterized protein n=1 Tax=Oryza meridionalis TaxID=40149 RepID=A0A0E0C078_9ORYZ
MRTRASSSALAARVASPAAAVAGRRDSSGCDGAGEVGARARRGRRRIGQQRWHMRRKAPSAVCCCFPFTVVELVVLAVVCVPATLCRRVVPGGRHRRVCSAKQKEMGELLALDVASPRSLAAAAAKASKVEVEFPATPMAEHLGEEEAARRKSGLQAALHWVARLLSGAREDARPAADLRVLLSVLACLLSPASPAMYILDRVLCLANSPQFFPSHSNEGEEIKITGNTQLRGTKSKKEKVKTFIPKATRRLASVLSVEESDAAQDGVADAAEVAALEHPPGGLQHRAVRRGAPRDDLMRRDDHGGIPVLAADGGLRRPPPPPSPRRRRRRQSYPHVQLAMLQEPAVGDNLTVLLRCACPSLPQVAVVVATALDMACQEERSERGRERRKGER